MTTSDRAVRKASRERLLRDFARAARFVAELRADYNLTPGQRAETALEVADWQTSRTRYACLMTAFGL